MLRRSRSFQLNTFAHLLTFKHFAPLLPSAKSKANELDHDPAHGVIPSNLSVLASLTARVGSIGDNGRGGWYRCALGMLCRALSGTATARARPQRIRSSRRSRTSSR